MISYTLLKQDGTEEDLGQYPEEVDLQQLYKWLNCRTVELIPETYYQEDWGECIVWGDEEGRFNNDNKRNPHTKVLGGSWDCVGNLVKQEEL